MVLAILAELGCVPSLLGDLLVDLVLGRGVDEDDSLALKEQGG